MRSFGRTHEAWSAADANSRRRKAIKYELAGFSQGRLEVTLASSADGNSRIGLLLERNEKGRTNAISLPRVC
jgi:hypothetical protein